MKIDSALPTSIDISFIDRYYVDEHTGELKNNDNCRASNFIEVLPLERYVKGENSTSKYDASNVCFYSESKEFISGIRLSKHDIFFISLENCKYIRFDGAIVFDNIYIPAEYETIRLCRTDDFSLVEQFDKLYNKILEHNSKIDDIMTLDKMQKYDYKANDIKWTEGYYVDEDYNIIKHDEACYSEMLRVQPNTWYKRNPESNMNFDDHSIVVFYNKLGEPIKSFVLRLHECNFKTTENTHYVRINTNRRYNRWD